MEIVKCAFRKFKSSSCAGDGCRRRAACRNGRCNFSQIIRSRKIKIFSSSTGMNERLPDAAKHARPSSQYALYSVSWTVSPGTRLDLRNGLKTMFFAVFCACKGV